MSPWRRKWLAYLIAAVLVLSVIEHIDARGDEAFDVVDAANGVVVYTAILVSADFVAHVQRARGKSGW